MVAGLSPAALGETVSMSSVRAAPARLVPVENTNGAVSWYVTPKSLQPCSAAWFCATVLERSQSVLWINNTDVGFYVVKTEKTSAV